VPLFQPSLAIVGVIKANAGEPLARTRVRNSRRPLFLTSAQSFFLRLWLWSKFIIFPILREVLSRLRSPPQGNTTCSCFSCCSFPLPPNFFTCLFSVPDFLRSSRVTYRGLCRLSSSCSAGCFRSYTPGIDDLVPPPAFLRE